MNRSLRLLPPLALGCGVLLISGVREQRAMQPLAPMRSIPRTLAGLEGRDLVVPEEERKVAGMSDYMMRVFTEDSIPRFTTYVGYYDRQVQGKSIHSPKNCLPGAGWEILNSARVPLPIAAPARVNRVLLANGGTRALVYYWYQGRGRISASEYAVKWELMRDAALKGRTEEALVRIVVPLGRASDPAHLATAVAQADALALRVAVALQAEVGKRLPGWASTAL